jgi:hypothetical protein
VILISLADKAVVDGGTSRVLRPRPSSKQDMSHKESEKKYGILPE